MEDPNYQLIKDKLKEIEQEKNIKIIYACDTGSRSKSLHSEDSDYDVKFIYIHNDYLLNFDSNRKFFDISNCFKLDPEDPMFEYKGYTLDRSIELLMNSNIAIIDIIYSDMIYVNNDNLRSKFIHYLELMHNKKSLIYHYINYSKRHYEKHIKGQDEIKHKAYIYVLHPIMIINYILRNESDKLIIYDFNEVFEKNIEYGCIDEIHDEIIEIVKMKKTMKGTMVKSIDEVNKYIDDFYQNISEENDSEVSKLFSKVKSDKVKKVKSEEFYYLMKETLDEYFT